MDLTGGTPDAVWTPEAPLVYLAASARITAEQVTRARTHLQARVRDLEEQRARLLKDARTYLDSGNLPLSARSMLSAATAEVTRQELLRVLELLQ